jgi:hypothetical protein
MIARLDRLEMSEMPLDICDLVTFAVANLPLRLSSVGMNEALSRVGFGWSEGVFPTPCGAYKSPHGSLPC